MHEIKGKILLQIVNPTVYDVRKSPHFLTAGVRYELRSY